jgi:photosystem II stability/assembly factor-like uncharacterized protein
VRIGTVLLATVLLALSCAWPVETEGRGGKDDATATSETPSTPSPSPLWQCIGPEGGFFPHFIVHPTDPKIVYAGGDDSSGIWKSTDGGDSWSLLTGSMKNVTGWWIAMDPSNPEILYSVDMYGRHPFIKSTDGGNSWIEKTQGLPRCRTYCVLVIPSSGDGDRTSTLFVGTGYEDGSTDGGAFKSTDGGESWTSSGPTDVKVTCLAAPDSGTIFAGTEKGLHCSRDGGINWEIVEGGLPKGSPITGLTVTAAGTVYAASPGPENSLFKSTDGGATWMGMGIPSQMIWDILVEPESNEQVIYCGTLGAEAGVLKTTDGGKIWNSMNAGISSKIIIGMTQGKDKTLFCSTFANEGILRSRDGARSWHRSNRGLNAYYVTGLTIDPNDPQRLIVTGLGAYSADDFSQAPNTWIGKLSPEGSMSWHLLENINVQTYAPSIPQGNSQVLLLGTFLKGVLLSTDGGAHVTRVHDTGYCTATAFDPDDPRIALASVQEILPDNKPGDRLLLRTEDEGATWAKMPVNFRATKFIAEKNSHKVWAATDNGIFLSLDEGGTWQQQGLAGQDINTVAQHPSRPESLYAGGKNAALFRTTDGGATWQPVTHPEWPEYCEVHELAFDPSDPEKLYVGLSGAEPARRTHDVLRGGFWTSPDGGRTWNELTDGLWNDHVFALAISPDGKFGYVGTYGGSIQRLHVGETKVRQPIPETQKNNSGSVAH